MKSPPSHRSQRILANILSSYSLPRSGLLPALRLRSHQDRLIMIFRTERLILTSLLFLLTSFAATQRSLAQTCEVQTFDDARFIVCTATPGKDDLRLFWKNARGEPFRRFPAIASSVADEGRTLVFAMNAGMYQTDFSPIGLYVENGKELRPANTKTMDGPPGKVPNFYKKPNGVFFLSDSDAGILPTADYLKRRPKARYATQSGPMLVIRNKLNPIFIAGSTDRTRRSGVGICRGRAARFAISEDAVNFHDFARLFRDHLGCPDALFLDG
ncbi:MAG: phosphodiester glycosidase family protein, partial [Pseudaminobacter sp.]